MPYVAPNTIDDIPAKHRKKLVAKLLERTVLGYGFSWARILKMLKNLQTTLQEAHGNVDLSDDALALMVKECVVGFKEDEIKQIRESLNEDIGVELNLNKIKTLRHMDPFGRPKDFLVMQGTSTTFNKQGAMDILVTEHKIPAKVIAEIWERATVKRPFTTIQARDIKEGGGEEG